MAQLGEAADELVQPSGTYLGERKVFEPTMAATQRLPEGLTSLAAERGAQPPQLREGLEVELPTERGDVEDERAELLEPGQRVEYGPAVGAENDISHVRQLFEER